MRRLRVGKSTNEEVVFPSFLDSFAHFIFAGRVTNVEITVKASARKRSTYLCSLCSCVLPREGSFISRIHSLLCTCN